MALAINPTNDAEIKRQKRNLTDSQKKNADLTKEGVVVNSLIKTPQNSSIEELYDSMIISDGVKMPKKLKENKTTEDKTLLPISLIATGVMATVAMITYLVKKSANINLTLAPEKKTDPLTRNVSIVNENIQGLYQMVQCPNKKTILAGAGVIALGAMAFMGKMFIDGFKEVWVKKREADIQKNLQENLIAVETQSFAGKIQIIRSMLAEKAKEFNKYLCTKGDCATSFEGNNKNAGENSIQHNSNGGFKYFALGTLTLGSIVGLGALSLKNLTKGKVHLEKYIVETRKKISEIIANSTDSTKEVDKINLKNMFQAIDSDTDYVKKELSALKWGDQEKNNFIEDAIFNTTKSTTKADRAIGGDGTPKPAFNSYVNDYKAFFYNYLLDSDNPQFKMLFWSITGLMGLSYGGKALGEAVKEVQVKKMNAATELDLQRRLVATELRNFKAKKDAAIDPLCEEFYIQAEKGKSKEQLRTIAENILFEVKNGPPFVYS